MAGYLNKEAVLKAAKDAMTWPEHAAGLVMRIERGEFDAPTISEGIDHLGLVKNLEEKDAQILRLSNALTSEKIVCDELKETCVKHEEEIQLLKEELGRGCPIDGYEGCPVMKEHDDHVDVMQYVIPPNAFIQIYEQIAALQAQADKNTNCRVKVEERIEKIEKFIKYLTPPTFCKDWINGKCDRLKDDPCSYRVCPSGECGYPGSTTAAHYLASQNVPPGKHS